MSPPPNQTQIVVAVDALDRGIADHFGVPRLRAAEDLRRASSSARRRWSAPGPDVRILAEVAAGVEHPVEAVRAARPRARRGRSRRTSPARRVRESGWCAAFPSGRRRSSAPRRAAAATPGPAEVVHVVGGPDLDHVWIGDAISSQLMYGPGSRTGRGSLRQSRAQSDARPIARPGDVPIPGLSAAEQRRAICRDIGSFPGARIGRQQPSLLQPVIAVLRWWRGRCARRGRPTPSNTSRA